MRLESKISAKTNFKEGAALFCSYITDIIFKCEDATDSCVALDTERWRISQDLQDNIKKTILLQ